jgi:hypothetical protein
MLPDPEAKALADHLDAINRRVDEQGPTRDAAPRMAKIMAAHEAACAALRRAEAEGEIDAFALVSPANSR